MQIKSDFSPRLCNEGWHLFLFIIPHFNSARIPEFNHHNRHASLREWCLESSLRDPLHHFSLSLSAKSRPDTINTRMINDESRGEKRWFTSHEFTEKLIGKLEETGGAGLKRNHEILSMKPSSLHPSSPSSPTIFRPISPDLRHFPPLGTRGMPD